MCLAVDLETERPDLLAGICLQGRGVPPTPAVYITSSTTIGLTSNPRLVKVL